MDVMLQAHEAKRVYPVPDGLRELSSDIVREVLRHQPEHINGFIADYLETMLLVREKARDSALVVSDIYRHGHFLDNLYRTKGVTKDDVNRYATIISAAWKGYVVRKKLTDWLKKKRKFQREKEERRQMKIEEFLKAIGITFEEAERAASIIQENFRQSRPGRFNEKGEWVPDQARIPLRERLLEGDKARGRYDRWDKKDFAEFFQLDTNGEIAYVWPKVGQLRKIPRELVTDKHEIVQFFAMRDNHGQEQYSFLKSSPLYRKSRGYPVGFLIPLPKDGVDASGVEVTFTNPYNIEKMGNYTFIFQDSIEAADLEKFLDLLGEHAKVAEEISKVGDVNDTNADNFGYDPQWVVPRALIQIEKRYLTRDDDEVQFVGQKPTSASKREENTFRAESAELTVKLVQNLLQEKCVTIQEALAEATNLSPYRDQNVGRLIPVEHFTRPRNIQKIVIVPESSTGRDEMEDMDKFEYVFLDNNFRNKKLPGYEPILQIPITRFQGYHRDYKGSSALEAQGRIFILGPILNSPDGKPFTHDSLFWDDFGTAAWYQLLHEISLYEGEEEIEQEEQEEEFVQEEEFLLLPFEEAAPEQTQRSSGRALDTFSESKEYDTESEIPHQPQTTPVGEPEGEPEEVIITDGEPLTEEEED